MFSLSISVCYFLSGYFTGIFCAAVRQLSMLFIDNKDSVFCILYSISFFNVVWMNQMEWLRHQHVPALPFTRAISTEGTSFLKTDVCRCTLCFIQTDVCRCTLCFIQIDVCRCTLCFIQTDVCRCTLCFIQVYRFILQSLHLKLG